jgi:hypothetical protein
VESHPSVSLSLRYSLILSLLYIQVVHRIQYTDQLLVRVSLQDGLSV